MIARIERNLIQRESAGKLRKLFKPQFDHSNEPYVDFSSNDYLGMSRSHDFYCSVTSAFEAYMQSQHRSQPMVGSTGSRLLTGNSLLCEKTEDIIARFHGLEYSLLCNSGWDLNFGLLSSLSSRDTHVIYDELSHNSIIMGIRNGRQKQSISFKHNDMNSLQQILRAGSTSAICEQYKCNDVGESKNEPETLIVVEAVYSMDGDVCPLVELLDVAAENNAMIIVDEAHSIGVYGRKGEGLISSLGLQRHPALLGVVYTYGKAFGTHGASFATNHASIISHLLNYSKPLVYSTSLPLHSVVCIQKAYETVASAEQPRAHILHLITHFKELCKIKSIATIPSDSPIQGVVIPGNEAVLAAALFVQSRGFSCSPIRAPTVPEGSERLRVILHAHNTVEEVASLCEALRDCMQDRQLK